MIRGDIFKRNNESFKLVFFANFALNMVGVNIIN